MEPGRESVLGFGSAGSGFGSSEFHHLSRNSFLASSRIFFDFAVMGSSGGIFG